MTHDTGFVQLYNLIGTVRGIVSRTKQKWCKMGKFLVSGVRVSRKRKDYGLTVYSVYITVLNNLRHNFTSRVDYTQMNETTIVVHYDLLRRRKGQISKEVKD